MCTRSSVKCAHPFTFLGGYHPCPTSTFCQFFHYRNHLFDSLLLDQKNHWTHFHNQKCPKIFFPKKCLKIGAVSYQKWKVFQNGPEFIPKHVMVDRKILTKIPFQKFPSYELNCGFPVVDLANFCSTGLSNSAFQED